jgi:hypothetical protein
VADVRVEREGDSAGTVDQALLDEARERLETVPDVGEIEIVIDGDLEASVRRRLPDEQARLFSVQRVSGAVGAKTIPTERGCAIVLDARLLFPGAAAGAEVDVPRMFEHEAWHIALRQRDEDFYSGLERLQASGADAQYVGQALVLIDDYRVERALFERGFTLEPSYLPATEETLEACVATLLDAIANRYADEPVTRCFETAVPAFNSLTTHLGYLAAAGADVADLRRLARWRRLVGDHYDALVASLAPMPSAAKGAVPDLLDETARAVAAVLRDWLELVGFRISDVDGGLFFDVLRHDFE